MRLPFRSLFTVSPFEDLLAHAEKTKECTWTFQQAIECLVTDKTNDYKQHRHEIIQLRHEADTIKDRIRHLPPKGKRLAVNKFQLFLYVKEQDHILDSVVSALNWISFKKEMKIPKIFANDFVLFTDTAIEPIEDICKMVKEARHYFKTYSEKYAVNVANLITSIHKNVQETGKTEFRVKRKIYELNNDGISLYHYMRLADIIGSIPVHAENVSDIMGAMIEK